MGVGFDLRFLPGYLHAANQALVAQTQQAWMAMWGQQRSEMQPSVDVERTDMVAHESDPEATGSATQTKRKRQNRPNPRNRLRQRQRYVENVGDPFDADRPMSRSEPEIQSSSTQTLDTRLVPHMSNIRMLGWPFSLSHSFLLILTWSVGFAAGITIGSGSAIPMASA